MRREGWADLYSWQVERGSRTPLFRQLYLQLRQAILARELRPGAKLPSTRALAARIDISRASVISAYEQLLAEGYLVGKSGSGTYISADLPEPIDTAPPLRARQRRDARRGTVAAELETFISALQQSDERPFITGRSLVDARTTDAWRKLSNRAFRSLDPVHLGYADPRGLHELRATISDYLRAARAVRAAPEQILVTSGTQQAIDITIRVLLRPGDQVWVEDPGYAVTSAALLAAKVALRPVPVDAQGLDVRAGIAAAPKARAVLVTPSHQFPLGVVLSMARRLELLAWARDAGAFVIEDDYQSEFRYAGRPLASLQGLDEAERVIYVGTLNKALFPGLRVGYAVVPPALLKDFVTTRLLVDRQPPSLIQVVVAEFMRQGHLSAHIRRMRLAYREQRDLLAAELTRRAGASLAVDAAEQGMNLVAYLRRGRSDVALESAARNAGVIVKAISPLYRKAPPRSGLLLGFSGFPRQKILPAATQLARIANSQSR
jgi:GntR family transcriptional regulator/MocR family aminotransferase